MLGAAATRRPVVPDPRDGRATAALLRRYAAERRPEDLEALVVCHQPLARGLARRHRSTGVPLDDLEQAAYLGLVKALMRFDPARGFAFTTYAVPTILGEVRRHCRTMMWPAHVPRPVRERLRVVRTTADRLAAERGRSPSVAEIAGRLGCDAELVVESLTAAATLRSVSLDARPEAGDDGEQGPLAERLGEDDPGYERAECHAAIEQAIPQLDRAERRALRLRYADGLSFAQIGRALSVGPAEAARLTRRSVDRIRALTGAAT